VTLQFLVPLAVQAVPITIETEASTHVPREFLSVTMDAGQFFPGHFWHDNVSFPFHSKAVTSLAAALSPAFFRVGGTEADRLWYDIDDCFSADHCGGKARKFREAVSRATLDAFFTFAQSVGYRVVFGLNAVVGPRDQHGDWVPDNAAKLIAFAASNYPTTSGWWELGNEPEAFLPFQHTYVGAAQLVKDITTLRSTLKTIAPKHKIAGIDSFGNPPFAGPDGYNMLPSFINHGGGELVDAVTYHWYPLLGNCAGVLPSWACDELPGVATVERAISVAFNDTEEKFAHMQRLVSPTGKPLWLGEGALAAAGGRDGVSNRFASSLFYLFELGQAAITGHKVVMRQCLLGASYSLLDVNSQMPLPDYWAALLHKKLMGTQVHRIAVSWPLRAFAHCHPSQAGHITALLVNPTRQPRVVNFTQAEGTVELHMLTAEDEKSPLTSASVRINGQHMLASKDGVIPPIPSSTMPADQEFTLPVFSAAFFTFAFHPCTVSHVKTDKGSVQLDTSDSPSVYI